MSELEELPRVPLHPHDRDAISNILQGYIGFLRNTPPLTGQKMKQMRELDDVRRRILSLDSNGEHHVYVTVDDVQTLLDAMRFFVQMIRRIVPKSLERDATLETVERLRAYLQSSLPVK
jgi:hypothetical protein